MMTGTLPADLAGLIDLDVRPVCGSHLCQEPGEEATALLICPWGCRTPIGLHCVMRITRRAVEAGEAVWRCKPCQRETEHPASYFDVNRIVPL